MFVSLDVVGHCRCDVLWGIGGLQLLLSDRYSPSEMTGETLSPSEMSLSSEIASDGICLQGRRVPVC